MLMYISAMNYVKGLLRKEEGQGMVEYALILALIAVLAITAFTTLGKNINNMATSAAGALHN